MTRIVGGVARGRRLTVPERVTRPTSDRAREGLFNTLVTELSLDGAQVLDLYAGSGAVGAEALSRGASSVVFVEIDRRAVDTIKNNLAAIAMSGGVVHRCTVETYLAATGAESGFDLVFADPPYAVPTVEIDRMLAALISGDWLRPGGVVVVERSERDDEPGWPNEIKAIKQRRYGAGCLWYGRREGT